MFMCVLLSVYFVENRNISLGLKVSIQYPTSNFSFSRPDKLKHFLANLEFLNFCSTIWILHYENVKGISFIPRRFKYLAIPSFILLLAFFSTLALDFCQSHHSLKQDLGISKCDPAVLIKITKQQFYLFWIAIVAH